MTTAHKVTAALASILFVLCIIIGYNAIKEHDGKVRAEADVKQADAVFKQSEQKELENQEERYKDDQALEAVKKQTVTTTQIVREVPKYITLPAAPIREVTAADVASQTAAQQALPDAPKTGDLIIPAASAKAFFDAQVTCKENETNLNSCTVSVSNYKDELTAKDAEIKALNIQVKGGTKWHRVLHDAKVIGIAGAIGVGLGYAAHR
jgi:hypothetical protein